jgi:hypothetical protein
MIHSRQTALSCQSIELAQSLPVDVTATEWYHAAEETVNECVRLGATVAVNSVCTAQEEAKIRETLKVSVASVAQCSHTTSTSASRHLVVSLIAQ